MSSLAADTFRGVAKRLGKLKKKQPWQAHPHSWGDPLRGDGWKAVSEILVEALDEMREEGSSSPLAALQEIAFAASLRENMPPHVHTAALWLTDTRLRVEAFRLDPGDPELRKPLERRGVLKPRVDSDP